MATVAITVSKLLWTLSNSTSVYPGGQTPRKLFADVSKSDFNTLSEGSQIALVWQHCDPSNNLAGTEVLSLVNGEIAESEFVDQQTQKATWAVYGGVGCLICGRLIHGVTRKKLGPA
jgi:hypothetical protein